MKTSMGHYATVTGAYWAFTITDGALRMLVLFHLHSLGHSPLEIASLFLFYEAFGVVTNLLGGLAGSRFGLKSTLVSGLLLQIVALAMMTVEASFLTIPWVMAAQSLSGVAKDLTKMSAKSLVKVVLPEGDQGRLMRWVAILTGSKNALKGLGFFVGAFLLGLWGFRGACLGLASLLLLSWVLVLGLLPGALGRTGKKSSFRSLFSHDQRINRLAAARFFLFGSRDVWFVLALPLYLATALDWSFSDVGAFLALWVVGYGVVQSMAPRLLRSGARSAPQGRTLCLWALTLLLPAGAVVAGLLLRWPPAATVIAGLVVFGVLFAVNSTFHSYLIVAFADRDRVAMKVGFYYMANAAGRFLGTLLSGWLYQKADDPTQGLEHALVACGVLILFSSVCCHYLHVAERAGCAKG